MLSLQIKYSCKCVEFHFGRAQSTRKRKRSIVAKKKKTQMFPVPLMTRWNSWFGAAKYVAECLDSVELLVQEQEESSVFTYFRNLSSDNIAVIKFSQLSTAQKTIEAIVKIKVQTTCLPTKCIQNFQIY
ncbi:hypothetical protein PR048_031958 [Dryococelus australis]|uniref:Uncharacterized protein n=1 Tax=Dryococelus australis TaxID=614101 RepID=A0ABQ9G6S1_9NEOP|nr:hypothetical protein PR048_031958 [Dryococelus australis]